MRLTTDLINESVSAINCLKERELNLRGRKIAAIENLGAALSNGAIDFTDNEIVQLGNFPLHSRLETLFLAHNRITSIQANVSSAIPNLSTLVLTQNRLTELSDLDPLAGFKKLRRVTLIGNPVASEENYRYWLIWRCPSLMYIDFKKVIPAEKQKAKELFGTQEEPTELAKNIMAVKSKGFAALAISNGDEESEKRHIYTEEEKQQLRAVLHSARTLEEMAALEKDFQEGRIPKHLLAGVDKMET